MQDLQSRGIYVKTLDGLIDTKAMKMMAPLSHRTIKWTSRSRKKPNC